MIVEYIIAKGAVALVHWGATHLTAAAAAHIAHTVAAMSVAQFVSTTVSACFVAGCIQWTGDRINNLKHGVQAVSDGNYKKAVVEFGNIALSADLDVNLLPDSVEKALEKLHLSSGETRKVTSWVRNHELEIARYVTSHK